MLVTRLTLSGLTLFATLLITACTPPSEPTADTEPPAPEAVQAEPQPTAAEPDATDAPIAEPATTATVRTGTFASAEHETTGGVELISENGQQTLVFDEAFATSDGPDLVVVLHRSANVIAESTPPAYPLNEEDYVVIAPLTAIAGTQEYVVPAEIDLSAFESVAVWCQAFNATFGAAPLQ